MLNQLKQNLKMDKKTLFDIILGGFIMAFTLVNIHAPSKITEGGILGLSLFAKNVLNFDPSIVNPICDIILFSFGFSMFGKEFLSKTIFTALVFAGIYKIVLLIGPVIPSLYNYPLISAILGGMGIGFGCGIIISHGFACGGEDSFAMIISKKFNIDISWSYLSLDIVILVLSLIYIPFGRIFYSLITTIVSSFILDQFSVDIKTTKEKAKEAISKQSEIILEKKLKEDAL